MIIPTPLIVTDTKVTLRGTNSDEAQTALGPDVTSSYTLAAPTPQPWRKILLAVSLGRSGAANGVYDLTATIGGVSATRLEMVSADIGTNTYGFAIFIADVPTGTTVDVELFANGNTSVRCVAAFEVFGLGVDLISSVVNTASATTVTANSAAIAGDFVFGFGYGICTADKRGAGITFDVASESGSVSRTYAYNTLADSKWHMTSGTFASEVYRSVSATYNLGIACIMVFRDKVK